MLQEVVGAIHLFVHCKVLFNYGSSPDKGSYAGMKFRRYGLKNL